MGFSTKPLVIDGRGHLLGRLAAIIAKTLLTLAVAFESP